MGFNLSFKGLRCVRCHNRVKFLKDIT